MKDINEQLRDLAAALKEHNVKTDVLDIARMTISSLRNDVEELRAFRNAALQRL